ncbi:Aspartic peptidase domain superfamily [Sesbania bispinosa]|nr:Aspartic peptidase domain superfamily [Sesbania bispinosa]
MDNRSRRVTPRRLSFRLEDFSTLEIGKLDLNATVTEETHQGGGENPLSFTPTMHGMQTRGELNLLGGIRTPNQLEGSVHEPAHTVIPTAVLSSILTNQEASVAQPGDALVTQAELRRLLQAERNGPGDVFDLEPPLVDEVLAAPYPMGYQPPSFRKFDGTGSAREHLMCFLDDLGVHRDNKGLRLKEFSKSLAGRAFTWDHALQCKETLPEADLVYGCIKNIEDGSQIFLSLGWITTFAELMRQGADVAEAIKRQGKRAKETENVAQACQLTEDWMKDGTIQTKANRPPLSKEQYEDPAYCVLHRTRNHSMMECWTIRRTFQKQLKAGKVLLPETEGVEGELHRRPLPNHGINAIVSSSQGRIHIEEVDDEANAEEETLGVKVMCALVDNGSGVNILPSYLFKMLNMPKYRLRVSDVTLNTFHGEPVESRGCVNAVLEVGPIKTVNTFQVVDGDPSYHLLLGCPWIHLHQCIPSTLHQCIKSDFRGREIEIPGVTAPFEAKETHLIDASLFNELAPPGSSRLHREQHVSLGGERVTQERHDAFCHWTPPKRRREENNRGIQKEYMSNGETRWRIL